MKPHAAAPFVTFPVSAVYLPGVDALLRALHGRDLLQGRIVDYSDGGAGGHTYAVLAVEGLSQPVIVPVEKLRNDCE